MKLFGSRTRKQESPAHEGVPILVRLWEEDDVWNASAFDLGVSVFGETLEDAKKNFEEALDSHFELLVEMGRAKATVSRLRAIAAERGFYEERLKVHETVTTFSVPFQFEGCYA